MKLDRLNDKKPLLIIITIVVVVICGYFSYAYASSKWPFAPLTVKSDNVNEQKPISIISVNEVITNRAAGTLQVKTPVDTNEQGDCTLTLVSKRDAAKKYSYTSSTKGIEGKTGCLDWNIGILTLPSGQYDMTVTFKGPTKTATTTKAIAIVAQQPSN